MIHARNLAAGALAALMVAGAVPALAAENAVLPEDPAGQEETVTEHAKPSRKRSENTDGTNSDGTVRTHRKGGRKRAAVGDETTVSSDGTVKAKPAEKPSRKPSSRPEKKSGTDSGAAVSDGTVNTEKPSQKPARRSEQQSDAVTSATTVV